MKKLVLSIVTMLAIAGTSKAQNALSVADITLPQNSEATLNVSFQFDVADTYTGYSFNLELPSDLEFVMGEGTDVACTKGACHDATHSVTANLNEGLVKVAGLSLSSKPLTGTSGVLLSFTVKPKVEVTVGKTYTGTIKDILIVPVEGAKKSLDASTFTITIGEPVDLRTILDETSATAPEAATGVDIRVKKTIKANEWSTICLPFAMDATQVKAAFGDDVKLGDFTGADSEIVGDDVVGITANFNTVTAIEANHPYIIKVSSPISEFTLDGINITPDEDEAYIEYDNGKSGSRRVVYSGFYGNYKAGTALEKFSLFLNGNKFWYSAGSTKIKAFRAYFAFLDVLTEVENAGAPIYLSFDNETTEIKSIERTVGDDKYYNLNGQRVETLKKGQIYIKNNKKVVVK